MAIEFRAIDSNQKVFEFEVDSVEDAIKYLTSYEKDNNASTRCVEKSTGKRIIGGILQFSKPF